MIQKIKEVKRRDWKHSPYSGILTNNEGLSDMGAAYSDFEDKVLEIAKIESCASILSNAETELMSENFRRKVQSLLTGLEEQEVTPAQTLNNITKIGKLRVQLNQDTDRRRSMDSQAAKVLGIRSSLSSTNVQNQQEEILRPYGSNFYEALQELVRAQRLMFFGEAHFRKDEANRRVALIGWASTTEDFLMLIGQLQNIFRLAKKWLMTIDLEGNEMLYDTAVPNFGEKEKLRFLLQRIDSGAQQLTIYRNGVDDGKNRGLTFSAVVESVQASILAHVPSLNNMPLQQVTNSFNAQSVTSSVSKQETQHLQQLAFQAGLEHEGNKRQRPPTACRHWDGTRCHYETATEMTCKFADSHVKDISSYVGPYIPKVNRPSYDDFEEWYKSKERNSSSK
jgi:hypothetical protein